MKIKDRIERLEKSVFDSGVQHHSWSRVWNNKKKLEEYEERLLVTEKVVAALLIELGKNAVIHRDEIRAVIKDIEKDEG